MPSKWSFIEVCIFQNGESKMATENDSNLLILVYFLSIPEFIAWSDSIMSSKWENEKKKIT